MPDIEELGAKVPKLYNWFASNQITSALIKAVVGFDQKRTIPCLSESEANNLSAKRSASEAVCRPSGRKLYLFLDEFTHHQEPEIAQDFIAILTALGYEVILPKHVPSGRAAISKGCLNYARKQAIRNVNLLSDLVTEEAPLVGIEPSCILSFRDEYPHLVPDTLREKAKSLGNNALLYDEFLMREIETGRIDTVSYTHLTLPTMAVV